MSGKLSAYDELVRDGIYPSAKQHTDALIQITDMVQKGRPIPRKMFGFETWLLLLHAHTALQNRTGEVEERDEIIDELNAKHKEFVTYLRDHAASCTAAAADLRMHGATANAEINETVASFATRCADRFEGKTP